MLGVFAATWPFDPVPEDLPSVVVREHGWEDRDSYHVTLDAVCLTLSFGLSR